MEDDRLRRQLPLLRDRVREQVQRVDFVVESGGGCGGEGGECGVVVAGGDAGAGVLGLVVGERGALG